MIRNIFFSLKQKEEVIIIKNTLKKIQSNKSRKRNNK